MAEGNNEVKIKVILDTDEAKARLAQLQGELDRVTGGRGGSGGSGGGVGGGIGGASSPASVVREVEKTGGTANDPKAQGRAMSAEFKRGLKGTGVLIGIEAATRFIELYRREMQIEQNLKFKEEQRVGQNNRQSRIEQAAYNAGQAKASQWSSFGKWLGMAGIGTAVLGGLSVGAGALLSATGIGATVGVPLIGAGGVMVKGGLAAGALGAAGGIGGYLAGKSRGEKIGEHDQTLTERNRVDSAQMSFFLRNYRQDMQHSQSQGVMALERILQFSGSKEQRLSLLRQQQDELENGDGQMSLKNLRAKRDRYIAEGDTESVEYQMTESDIAMQTAQLENLRRKEFQEQYMTTRLKPWEGSDFADSFSRKGLYMGAQVDVAAANKPIIDELKRLNDMMRGFLSQATDHLGDRADGALRLTEILGAKSVYR